MKSNLIDLLSSILNLWLEQNYLSIEISTDDEDIEKYKVVAMDGDPYGITKVLYSKGNFLCPKEALCAALDVCLWYINLKRYKNEIQTS